MTKYLIRRLGWSLVTLIGMSVLVFMAVRLVPGDAVSIMLDQSPAQDDPEVVEELRQQLGIDGNVFAQYWSWSNRAVRGDFGESIFSGEDVLARLIDRIPISLELALLGTLFSLTVGVLLGVVSAVAQDSPVDYIARIFAMLWLSLPGFWIATIFIVVASIQFNWIPPIRYTDFTDGPWENLQQMLPAAIILALHSCAVVMRMTRSSLLEVLRQDYIRTARAKGLAKSKIVLRHALRNAFIPVITIVGAQFASLLGGIILLETVFNIPGAGRLMLDATVTRDYPQIQVCVMYVAVVIVTVNLIVDLSYAVIDPRITYS